MRKSTFWSAESGIGRRLALSTARIRRPTLPRKPGDAARGRELFAAACSSCHGPDGRGARTIADRSYLALVTDQHLRTVIIVGMPNLGMPDWRGHSKPLTDADVADLVAWLATQRESLSAHLNH